MNKTLAVLAATLIAAGSAQAGLIEQTATIALTQTDFTERLSFDQFDPANGVLTGVSFMLNGSLVTTFSGVNTKKSKSAPAAMISNRLDGSIEFALPDGSVTLNFSDRLDKQVDALSSFSETLAQTLPDRVYNQDPANFYGMGQFWVEVAAVSRSTVIGPGNLSSDTSSEAGASLTLRYDYSASEMRDRQAVPEPATLALAGLALAGLALTRRRA